MDLPNRMTDKGFETIPPDCQQPGGCSARRHAVLCFAAVCL